MVYHKLFRGRKPNHSMMKNNRNNRKIVKRKPTRTSAQMSSIEATIEHIRKVERIPKNYLVSDAIIVDLIYFDSTYTRVNPGSAYMSYRMRMNSIYDPDPALGTGAIPGYTEWANFFNSYRVLKFKYDLEVSNQEAFPQDVLVCPSRSDLGVNYVNIYDFLGNPRGKSHTISSTGGQDRCRFLDEIDLGQYYGNPSQYLGDDGFGGSAGGNPAVMLFFNIATLSTANQTAAKGIFTKGKYTFTVLMHGRSIQTT
jgi:hypothetical protein